VNPGTLSGGIALVHALVGVAFVAGLVGRWIVLAGAERARTLPEIRLILALAAPFERLVQIGSLLVFLLGLITALIEHRLLLGPLQGGPVDWLFVSLVLYLSILPLIPLVFLPRGRVLELALRDAEVHKEVTPALRRTFRDPVVFAAHVYELGAVTVVLGLMFTKPF
jgi:hypothetical protein